MSPCDCLKNICTLNTILFNTSQFVPKLYLKKTSSQVKHGIQPSENWQVKDIYVTYKSREWTFTSRTAELLIMKFSIAMSDAHVRYLDKKSTQSVISNYIAWYASYWNAFLKEIVLLSVGSSLSLSPDPLNIYVKFDESVGFARKLV